MAKDKEYKKMIHTTRWLRLRKAILTAHPLCERCAAEGRIEAATEVHHVRPVEEAFTHAERIRRMYDPKNLRALSHDCHVKTHTDLGRSGKVATHARMKKQVAEAIRKAFGGD